MCVSFAPVRLPNAPARRDPQFRPAARRWRSYRGYAPVHSSRCGARGAASAAQYATAPSVPSSARRGSGAGRRESYVRGPSSWPALGVRRSRRVQPLPIVVNLEARSKKQTTRAAPAAPRHFAVLYLLNVAVFVGASARWQVAGLAKNTNARHERITRHPDRVRWGAPKETILWPIRQCFGLRQPRRAIARMKMAVRAMYNRHRGLVFVGRRRG
jgi:hypothetical protein